MRHNILIFLLVVGLMLIPSHLFSQMLWLGVNDSASFGPRCGHGMVDLKGDLILFGGCFGDSLGDTVIYYHEIWRSTDRGRTWDFLGLIPWHGMAYFATVVIDDSTFLLSGGLWKENGVWYASPQVWRARYRHNSLAWEILCDSAFPPRSGHAMARIGKRCIVAGGHSFSHHLSDVYISDDQGRSWQCLKERAEWQRSFDLTMATVGNTLVLCGSFLGPDTTNRRYQVQVWISGDAGKTWYMVADSSSCPQLWEPGIYTSLVSYRDTLVLCIPSTPLSRYTDKQRVIFSPDTGRTWFIATDSLGCRARNCFPMVISRDTLVLAGGWYLLPPRYLHVLFYDVWISGGPITGLQEESKLIAQPSVSSTSNIFRSPYHPVVTEPIILLDITGRKVAALKPGANVWMSPGVYFIVQPQSASTRRKLIVVP